MRIALILNTGRDFKTLLPFLVAHPSIVGTNVNLLVMLANCLQAENGLHSTFEALSKAWCKTTRRPVILERMVRLAEVISGREAAEMLLKLHLKHYPGRHKTFQNHFDWFSP